MPSRCLRCDRPAEITVDKLEWPPCPKFCLLRERRAALLPS
jgi:hypothetical protein